jgi:hypothetical protein
MSSAYWGQWSHAEIMSMHGVEEDEDYDTDLEQDEDDTDLEQDEGDTMEDLGLSWRDFM